MKFKVLEKKYKKFLNVILIIIIIAIIGVASYVIYEYVILRRVIDANASDILEAFDKYINDLDKSIKNDDNILYVEVNNQNNENNNSENEPNSNTESGGTSWNNSSGSNGLGYGLTYGGYKVLGKIELPAVGLKYPILDTLSDADAIDVSVAVQYGVGLNKVGNTIIMGHNYRNGAFFGSNKWLSEGDKVYITDLSGLRVEYTIYKKYLTEEADYSYAQRDTGGTREITLVTCHTDNRYRLVILARESQ